MPKAARKRTGAEKRKAQREYGVPPMPDESKAKTPEAGARVLTTIARRARGAGYSLRATPIEDITAFPAIDEAAQKHGRELAERMLTPALVAGARLIARQLGEIVSLSTVEEQALPASPGEITVARAAKFAMSRRRAIARLCRGEQNRALRHSFGISRPMKNTSLEEVRRSVVALLAGREAHPGSPAARMITPGDVQMAKELVAELTALKSRAGERKAGSMETARTREVLHAALELYYDRFAAAVDVAFEGDDGVRVALLSLVPRRKDQRKAAKAAPPVAAGKAANA